MVLKISVEHTLLFTRWFVILKCDYIELREYCTYPYVHATYKQNSVTEVVIMWRFLNNFKV